MKIQTYLNTTAEEIDSRKYNIWIGISLGNKYFTKANIKEYIEWALAHSKDGVMVVIGDLLHAVNLEILSTMSRKGAMDKALKLGDQILTEVGEIIAGFPESEQAKIELVRWVDVTKSADYKYNYEIFQNEYHSNPQFRDNIIAIIKNGRPDRQSTINKLSQVKIDRLADYVLAELPVLINPIHSDVTGFDYSTIIYPGLSDLDKLKIALNNRASYPELVERLKIKNKIQALEGYLGQ